MAADEIAISKRASLLCLMDHGLDVDAALAALDRITPATAGYWFPRELLAYADRINMGSMANA